MGEHVEFPGGHGYLATPDHGSAGPALIVLGGGGSRGDGGIDRGAIALSDRFATEGFTALAVARDAQSDGVVEETPDGVTGKVLIQSGSRPPVPLDAVAFLEGHPLVHGKGVGVIGLYVGGFAALDLAAAATGDVRALVVFDGPALAATTSWADVQAPAECHVGLADRNSFRDVVAAFEAGADERRAKVSVFHYADAPTRFWDGTGPSHDADADREAFVRTLSFLRAHLG